MGLLSDAEAMATIEGVPEGEEPTQEGGVVLPAELPMVADKAALEAHIGRELPVALFDFAPWGTRLVVAHVSPERKVGSIWIPSTAQTKVAQGWVVSVGPRVGKGRADYTGWCPYHRSRLLGVRCVFGQYAGQTLKVSVQDDDYDSGWSILSENEIWGIIPSSWPREPIPAGGWEVSEDGG